MLLAVAASPFRLLLLFECDSHDFIVQHNNSYCFMHHFAPHTMLPICSGSTVCSNNTSNRASKLTEPVPRTIISGLRHPHTEFHSFNSTQLLTTYTSLLLPWSTIITQSNDFFAELLSTFKHCASQQPCAQQTNWCCNSCCQPHIREANSQDMLTCRVLLQQQAAYAPFLLPLCQPGNHHSKK